MSWSDGPYIRLRLWRWGRWGAENGPAMAPSIFGRLIVPIGANASREHQEMPPEIAEIDGIVHKAPDEYKTALIGHYQRRLGWVKGGREFGLSSWAFKQRVRAAERHVQSELFSA